MTPQLVSVTFDNGTSISSDNLSVLAGGFKVTFNEAMKASSMQVNDGSTGDIKINCNSANTLRLGADNTTTPGQNQCRELAQMSSSDNLSWTTLIRAFGNSHCPVTDNLTGTPSGTCAATLNPGTNYKLKLATGMTDLAGNALASENTTLFRTRETPSIISTFPDNASDNTSVYLAPVFHFDSPMHPASFIDNLSLTVGCSPNPSSGSNCGFSSSYDSTADNLTVNPTGSWPDNTTITVTIKGRNGNFPYSGAYEAKDGIFMTSDYVMNFKTHVTYGSDSIVNLSADGVSFKATQFNSIQLSDNESNLGNLLTFKEPTFVWGRSNANSNSREWISKALKGKEFISYIYRDNNQKITIYSLDNTSINIYKGENLLVTDNLSENIRKVYNLSNVENQVVRILSTGNILLTIQGETGNDFRPLVPLNQEIYSAGNSQYGYVVINSFEAGINIEESCSDNTSKTYVTEANKGFIENLSFKEKLYKGVSCMYYVNGNQKIAGSSFADSNGYDSTSYLPRNLFQKITPIPFETDYLKIVSNYSSNCSFSSYDNSSIDNFSLTGSNKVFQYYEASLKQKGIIDCDSPVMVIAHDNATKDEINIIIPWPK